MADQSVKTVRRDTVREYERRLQESWGQHKLFQADAPAAGAAAKEKFFVTFPYPYMNGRLHLGHGFSFSKCEFAARFQRLRGKNVLWGFGLHVTGTPIAACAQKLRNEMQKYGCPPQFPEELLDKPAPAAAANVAETDLSKHKGKRLKVGPAKPQWVIMEGMGIPASEIPKFADPMHWLKTFPPLALDDLKTLGCHVDYRRSFITTDVNPFYDSFVRWQFEKLQAKGYLGFGERYCIYSPLDGQPCADHDRATGEGVAPMEYVLIKIKVQEPKAQAAFAAHAALIGDKDVVLPAATLRAETIVGQTNCWVSPDITYYAYEVVQVESPAKLSAEGKATDVPVPVAGAVPQIFVMTARSAHNLAFQNYMVSGVVRAVPTPLFEVPGAAMVGLPLSSPYSPYSTIYNLPMATISDTKGTGVVMSVPSDSPDDYINFTQLVKKPDYRAKLNLKDEWVMPFSIVPIITIPGELGENAAEVAIAKFKINGPKDADKLTEAKALVYQEGFYNGVMKIGPFTGKKVSEAKKLMADLLMSEQNALIYQEPAKVVMSRSGDECVVALADQWFLSYSHPEWKDMVKKHLQENFETFFPSVKNGLLEAVDWLSEWPCSRNFGLGTQIPASDPKLGKVIVDSLSDSTIYMAYYTVAKYLHAAKDGSQNLDGRAPNAFDILPEHMSNAAWDFIFQGKGTAASVHAATGLPLEAAEGMRREFEYFYPVDLRASGKDLIQNHLAMALFNHAAIWDNDSSKWPRAMFCNGHILVDGEKMSKSAGNFIILQDAIERYTADGTRLALADSGDSLDDANFKTNVAAEFAPKLTTLLESFKERQANLGAMRSGEKNIFDRMFENTLNLAIKEAEHHYERMQFRLALNTIFYELLAAESQYKIMCGSEGQHSAVVARFMEVFPLLLMPIAPHTCEVMWTEILKKPDTIHNASFPTPSAPVDAGLLFALKLVQDIASDIRSTLQKKKKSADNVWVYYAPQYLPWQLEGLKLLSSMLEAAGGTTFPADTIKQITSRKDLTWVDPKQMQDVMAFISFTKQNAEKYGLAALSAQPLINDGEILSAALNFLQTQTGVPSVHVLPLDDVSVPEHAVARGKARPGQPVVAFAPEPKKK
jgi:leucyl-tRNA synthetase